jgi:hypothetical protein
MTQNQNKILAAITAATVLPTVRAWDDATLEEAEEFGRLCAFGWPASEREFYQFCLYLAVLDSWAFDLSQGQEAKARALGLLPIMGDCYLDLDEVEGSIEEFKRAWDFLRGADFDLFGLLPRKLAREWSVNEPTKDWLDLGCERYHADKDDRACS